jgi:hypothetical protein
MDDNTTSREFIEQSADRLLAWEWVHGVYCGGKHLRPSSLAERIGLTTVEVQELVESALVKAKIGVLK